MLFILATYKQASDELKNMSEFDDTDDQHTAFEIKSEKRKHPVAFGLMKGQINLNQEVKVKKLIF